MTVFIRQLKDAKAKIAAKGELCTWFKPGPDVATSTPWQPDFTTPAIPFVNTSIVWIPISSITKAGMREDIATDVSQGWLYGLLAGFELPFVPQYRDLIQRSNGDLWYLERFDQLGPDGPVILYKFYARQ